MIDTGDIFIELGALLVALAVMGRLAVRVGLPTIPLYLIVGLAVGEGGLVPIDASEEFIEVGSELGVVLLLFLLGLEYSAVELTSSLRSNATAGVLDAVANAIPGVVAGLLLGWEPLAVMLLGGLTYISSSGIVAKLINDLGRVGNRETSVVLSVLVMEDLAMAVFLPIAGALLVDAGAADAALSVVVALAAVAVVLIVATRHSRQVSRLLFTSSTELLVLTLLGITVLVAGVADELQVSAAVGAFLVGIVVEGDVAEAGRRLLEPMRDIFAGLFFVFFGLRIDPADLTSVLVPALLMAIAGIGTKVFTGWWAAGRAGIGPRGRRRAGFALVPRGEFSIVLAGLGVSAGVEPRLGLLAAAYVLILAFVGALLTRYGERLVPSPGSIRPARRAGI